MRYSYLIYAVVRKVQYKFIFIGDTRGRTIQDKIYRLMFAERSKGDTVEYIRLPYTDGEIEMFQRQTPYEKAQRRKRANVINNFHKDLYSGKRFGDVLHAEEKSDPMKKRKRYLEKFPKIDANFIERRKKLSRRLREALDRGEFSFDVYKNME